MPLLFLLAHYALTALSWMLITLALLSWFPIDPRNRWVRLLHTITDPILHPIRSLIPPIGGMSFDILIALMILWLVQSVLDKAIHS
ncbi:MAG TPA: YggT family protein [Geothrix sp.]|jgi:YggT family protein